MSITAQDLAHYLKEAAEGKPHAFWKAKLCAIALIAGVYE